MKHTLTIIITITILISFSFSSCAVAAAARDVSWHVSIIDSNNVEQTAVLPGRDFHLCVLAGTQSITRMTNAVGMHPVIDGISPAWAVERGSWNISWAQDDAQRFDTTRGCYMMPFRALGPASLRISIANNGIDVPDIVTKYSVVDVAVSNWLDSASSSFVGNHVQLNSSSSVYKAQFTHSSQFMGIGSLHTSTSIVPITVDNVVSSIVMYSDDSFTTVDYLSLPFAVAQIGVFPRRILVCSSVITGLKQGIANANGNGVVWSSVIGDDPNRIAVVFGGLDQQNPFEEQHTNEWAAIGVSLSDGTSSIYASNTINDTFSVISGCGALCGNGIVKSIGKLVVTNTTLVLIGNTLISHSEGDGWVKRYEFLTSTSFIPERLSISKRLSNELFVWGGSGSSSSTSTLLYSIDGGYSFFTVSNAKSNVTSFSSSSKGFFSFTTADNECFVGSSRMASNAYRLIDHDYDCQHSTSTSSSSTLFFDSIGSLKYLSFNSTGTGVIQNRNLDTQLRTTLDLNTDYTTRCPFDSIAITANRSTKYTRSSSLVSTASNSVSAFFPKQIFLDRGVSYSLTIDLTSREGNGDDENLNLIKNIPLGISVIPSTYIEVMYSDVMVSYNHRRLDVKISDRKDKSIIAASMLPGQDSFSSVVSVEYGAQCDFNFNSIGDYGDSMLIQSGCAPYQSLLLKTPNSDTYNSNSNSTWLDLYFDDDYRPELYVLDSITGQRSRYKGRFRFEIIEAGSTRRNVLPLSSQAIHDANYGSYRVWTVAGDTVSSSTGLTFEEPGITWTCAPGSMCNEVFPGESGAAPAYYFVAKISTHHLEPSSYCSFETYALIHLYGIPLSLGMTAAPTFGLVGAFIVIVSIVFVITQLRDRMKTSVNIVVDDEDMDIFGRGGGGGGRIPRSTSNFPPSASTGRSYGENAMVASPSRSYTGHLHQD